MPKNLTPEKLLYGIFVFLLGFMPLQLFLSRWFSLYTGGLDQWDAIKDVVTLIGLGLALWVAWKQRLDKDPFFKKIILLGAAYGLLHAAFFIFNGGLDQRSFILGMLFNCRLLAYLFIGMTVSRTYRNLSVNTVLKVVVAVSTVTCLFAVAQYLLPKDFMTHFGYTLERGVRPMFFIDDKPDFPRVMSTLRDPNSFGAYLIFPVLLLWTWWNKKQDRNKRILVTGLLLLHGLAIFLTFSRGAWLGLVVGGAFVVFVLHKESLARNLKKHAALAAVAVVAVVTLAGLAFASRQTYVFQNIFLHSDQSTVQADPNELRIEQQNLSYRRIADNPLGYGPGTAGLASIGNPQGAFLTENYYLQIGYEVGVIGLVLFMAALIILYVRLTRQPDDSISMRVALLAAFWAYALIATLIHLWSNESVAAQWWLLAGLAAGAGAQRAARTSRS